MHVYLVHHGEAVGPEVDPQRPLSARGREDVERVASEAAARGARPAVVWHSGKLRAKQTAEIYWRACNALAELSAARDLQPNDPPEWLLERLRRPSQDVMVAGHFPHLPLLLRLMVPHAADFPQHGVVALSSDDEGKTWKELWRVGP